jgi:hemolysin D
MTSAAKPGAASKALVVHKDELAFLPAALEIVETPPSPLARAMSTTIIVFIIVAIAWACFGKIDIVATATGKIIPNERVKVIQPFETGVVHAILVSDGEAVKAGQALIELDPTIDDAERKHIESDLLSARLDVARLSAALSKEDDRLSVFQAPDGAGELQISVQKKFLTDQIEENRAKLAALDHQRAQKQAESDTIEANINKLEKTLEVLQQRVDIRQQLYDRELGSKANYLEILQSKVETEQELLVQRSKLHEAEAALAAIVQTRVQTEAEFNRTLSSDLVEAQRKADGLAEDLIKARQRSKLQILRAPVDGTVQQLAVHTVGGVVTPAQALLVVVPSDSHLEIEAMVPNKDIGFIHAGQEVEIKVDTFNFTHYGLLHGKVLSLSQDAITRDKPEKAAEKEPGAPSNSSEPKGQELIYAARVALDRTQMQIDENLVNLAPGMAVTVEIKTGERSIMSYLLSPLMRYRQESLRER